MRPARSPRRIVVERPRRGQVAAADGFEQTKFVAIVAKDRTKLQRELLQCHWWFRRFTGKSALEDLCQEDLE